jgi:hypothetical protein
MELATNSALRGGDSGRNKRGWKQRKRKGLPRNEGRRDKEEGSGWMGDEERKEGDVTGISR